MASVSLTNSFTVKNSAKFPIYHYVYTAGPTVSYSANNSLLRIQMPNSDPASDSMVNGGGIRYPSSAGNPATEFPGSTSRALPSSGLWRVTADIIFGGFVPSEAQWEPYMVTSSPTGTGELRFRGVSFRNSWNLRARLEATVFVPSGQTGFFDLLMMCNFNSSFTVSVQMLTVTRLAEA